MMKEYRYWLFGEPTPKLPEPTESHDGMVMLHHEGQSICHRKCLLCVGRIVYQALRS
jgi:hypothetical protein